MAFYSQISRQTVRYQGEFQVGARVEFFDAGTNTVRTMYQDGALNSPFDPTDITADANAQLPNIWGQGGAYKAIIYAFGGAVIDTIDNVPGDVTAGGGGGGGGSTTQVTGDIQPSILSGTRTGFVRGNGRTIGSAASGATEFADPTAQALFLALWDNTLFTVSGGRGASAAADWGANKTITLPDSRLCALIGSDGMGNTATNLFAALTFSAGNAATVGSKVGTATHTLTTAQLASHSHSGSTDTAGLHQHTGVTDSQGDHSHGGSTDVGGFHAHNVGVNAATSVVFVAGGAAPVPAAGMTNYTTAPDGAHNHSITTTVNGAHGHNYTTNANGAHSHAVTVLSAGSDAAHPNVQPSLLVTFFIKL